MPELPDDPSLDAQLRDVPLPDGLTARLRGSLVPSDEQIDLRLRDVPVPSLVLARLRMTPADAALDDSVGEVSLPVSLTWQLRNISRATLEHRVRQLPSRMGRLATAAALFITVTATLFSAFGALVSVIYPPTPSDDLGFAVIYDGPLNLESVHELEPSEFGGVTSEFGGVTSDVTNRVLLVSDQRPSNSRGLPPGTDLPSIASPFDIPQSKQRPVEEWTSLVSTGFRPLDDVVLLRYGVLGAPQFVDDSLPDLESLMLNVARGIEPPRVRGYHREFFLKHRIFPPISPSAAEALQSVTLPLVLSDDSYRRALALVREDRYPQPNDVRVEEFIAALDYHYPPPSAGKLAIRTAAGPSLFGSNDAGLLQVGVQAGTLPKRTAPAHLVVALDASSSMGRGDKLAAVRQGVARLFAQLGPRDRVSLVIFAEEVLDRIENVTRDDAAEIDRVLAQVEPAGGTNLALGLQQAASLAMTSSGVGKQTSHITLITDSRAPMPEDTAARLKEVLSHSAAAGAQLAVIDVSGRNYPDPLLTELSGAGEGEVFSITTGQQIYYRLLEIVAGRSAVVASEAQLTIRFKPECVAAYRLLGHEANAMSGLTAATTLAEFRAGDAATSLLEIWFQPTDGDKSGSDDVGVAELTWVDPATGAPQKVRQRISRLQFAPTFAEAAPALQAASIAAETAEQLRGTHDALRELNITAANGRGLSGVLEVARDANPRATGRDDFQQLLKLVRSLDKTRPR